MSHFRSANPTYIALIIPCNSSAVALAGVRTSRRAAAFGRPLLRSICRIDSKSESAQRDRFEICVGRARSRALEPYRFRLNRNRALSLCFERDLIRKPASTFRDHALTPSPDQSPSDESVSNAKTGVTGSSRPSPTWRLTTPYHRALVRAFLRRSAPRRPLLDRRR